MMNVFVLNQHGEALMPCKPRKAKVLLRTGKAHVIKRNPFTIQLDVGSTGYKQDLTLGVDTGHAQVGFSVVSTTKEIFSAVAILRNDISKKMQQRSAYRRTRRTVRINNVLRNKPSASNEKIIAHCKKIETALPLLSVDSATSYSHKILLLLKASTMFQKAAKTKALILFL
jgi:hypothetical protein